MAYILHPYIKRIAPKKSFNTYAIGGSSAHEWAKKKPYIDEALSKYGNSDIVLIQLGTNDSGLVHLRKDFAKNAARIVSRFRPRCVIWVTPPKIKVRLKFLLEGARVSGADHVLDYTDLELDLERDGIHPSYLGNRVWAKKINQDLKGKCNERVRS